MVEITNPKVAGLEPRWAPFPGFSLLFDNPGAALSRDGDLFRLACASETDPALPFYRALGVGLEDIGAGGLACGYAFCRLPAASHHVTVWDGCNAANLYQVPEPERAAFAAYLDGLPDSICRETEFTRTIAASPLVTGDWSLCFQYGELGLWSEAVLVAELLPADPASERTLSRLVEERTRHTAGFREKYGIGPALRYHPHVSLGYFANRELARAAQPRVAEWSETVQGCVGDRTLDFRSISLYGFTDMAHFFKSAASRS